MPPTPPSQPPAPDETPDDRPAAAKTVGDGELPGGGAKAGGADDEIIVVDSGVSAREPAARSTRLSSGDLRNAKVMLEARQVYKSFGEKKVLQGIDVVVRQRETLCIVGGSGCGKSTLLRVLSGLTPPDERESSAVLIGGENVLTADRKELDRIRGRLGMVFQYAALLASYTVFENVALPLLEKGTMPRAEIRDRVADVLEKVHLPGTEELMPAELSGGMRKRVGIARAVVTQPDVILFDEPTSGLDPIMTATFDQLVLELRETLKLTSVIVSHDLSSVYRIADRVIMLHHGHKVIDDRTEAFQESNVPEVRQFVRGEPASPHEMD